MSKLWYDICRETYPLLGQLPRTLVLAVPQQFNHTALVRCQAGNFLDDFADEGGAFAERALAPGYSRFGIDGCDFLEDRQQVAY